MKNSTRVAHYLKRVLMLCFSLYLSSIASTYAIEQGDQNGSQPIQVVGKVVQVIDLSPIPGVTVLEKGTRNGTVTDSDGSFKLEVSSSNSVLQVSFIGYKSQEISVSNRSNFTIELEESYSDLGEAVVIGYQSQKEANISGSVAKVDIQSLESRRVPVLTQALQGQIAGVQVTQSTGAPGDDIEIRIRGNGTIGNNNPLYIIDGIPSREISFLNPADIESMTVLKDAAATSIYGSRASAGVVVITTKSGKTTQGINVNYFGGVQRVTNLPRMLNAQEYMTVVERAWDNAGYSGTNPYTGDRNRSDFADTNWLEELFEMGRTHNVQLSSQGGNEKTRYMMSGGFFTQDGIVKFNNDKFNRLNFRTNVSSQIHERVTVGTNVQFSYTSQDRISSSGDSPGTIRHAFLRPPIIPVYKSLDDPTYSPSNPFTDLPFYRGPGDFESSKYEFSQNPLAIAYFADDKMNNFKTFGNVFGEYNILGDGSLKFRTNFGADINFFYNRTFAQNYGDDDGGGAEIDRGQGRQNRPNSLAEARGQAFTYTWNNTFNFDKTFGDHYLNAVVGTEFISYASSFMNASRMRFDFTSPNFQYLDFGNTERDLWNGGLAEEWALFSYFGSATYVFKNKYMVTGTMRADASSRFASNNQWGYFPAMSAGWMISEEDFMTQMGAVSELKIRGSWGQQGNQEIPNYAYLTLFARDQDRYQISRYGNSELKWETTTQANIGFDLGLFSNKLFVSMDYFHKVTSDILLPISLPQIVGNVSPTFVNAGQVTNKGLELAINYRNSFNNFKYFINTNLATLKNVVDNLHPNLPYITGPVTRIQPGQPLNAYYGFVQEGIYQNQEEINQHLSGTTNPPQQPGDIRFRDLDGNGVINDNDRTFIGNPNPRLAYGLTFGGNYKSFDFNILFQGVQGVERYNDLKKIIDYDTRPFNFTERVLDSWSGEGTSNTIPRVSFTDNGGSRVSDVFVEDASYLRLKNLEIGYTLKTTRVAYNSNVRFYLSGQNLLTFTKYSGLDPESTALIDMGTYPQARSFLVGVNLNF
ncbi:SusC/RagA family TonB-linked outer membrane protein [Belliella kenyensis]|uniref:SusC/RagA family TonB-linked outer membrane protein n=1 Tax=Belliella kenyensis TaxID=1472724 RepID=A0ABV8EIH5_9BACT|nr:TonB-dependent receptor [Belliella kenyensis]MCH7401115.1 TonB-dependent receptor [Belliella kenyensis]MDN3604112.1 TonB-dependent receptor [Belliella kenyensis]